MSTYQYGSRTASYALIATLGLALLFKHSPTTESADGSTNPVRERVGGLKQRVQVLEKIEALPGTVLAYSGDWPPAKLRQPDGSVMSGDRWTEDSIGWMKCDGRALSADAYPELFSALGFYHGKVDDKFLLPDLRGMFLRGVDDGTDRDKVQERQPPKDSNAKDDKSVGSYQAGGTGKPKALKAELSEAVTFRGVYAGKDTIGSPLYLDQTGATEPQLTDSQKIDFPRRVTLSDWDSHTRPMNIAIFWIIKSR